MQRGNGVFNLFERNVKSVGLVAIDGKKAPLTDVGDDYQERMRYHRESRNSLVDRCSLRWLLVAVLAVAALETVLADPSYCALPRDEIPQCSVVDELTPEGTNTTFFAVKQEVTNNVTEWQNHYVLKYRYRLENLLRAYNCDTPYGIGTCQ